MLEEGTECHSQIGNGKGIRNDGVGHKAYGRSKCTKKAVEVEVISEQEEFNVSLEAVGSMLVGLRLLAWRWLIQGLLAGGLAWTVMLLDVHVILWLGLA